MEIFEAAEKMWKGQMPAYATPPFNELVQISPGIFFFNGVSNMTVIETSDGLIIVDPGANAIFSGMNESQDPDYIQKYKSICDRTQSHVHTLIYTHGHLDHICGGGQYVSENQKKGYPYPQIIAHETMVQKFNRFRKMAGQMTSASRNIKSLVPSDTKCMPPTMLFHDRLQIRVGACEVLIRHGRSETDEHAWVYFPVSEVLCTGGFFIWATPTAGDAEKAPLYIEDWIDALRDMSALMPKVLVPGHGLFILGQDRIAQALDDTASFLEIINDQTLEHMNRGLSLDEVIEAIRIPENLCRKPYLHPACGDVESIVRNIWRSYGDWYDGIPSNLKPAPAKRQAEEIVRLAGGTASICSRVELLMKDGDLRMATHLAEWAYLGAPEDHNARMLAQFVYEERAKAEVSLRAKGIFSGAAKKIAKD